MGFCATCCLPGNEDGDGKYYHDNAVCHNGSHLDDIHEFIGGICRKCSRPEHECKGIKALS